MKKRGEPTQSALVRDRLMASVPEGGGVLAIEAPTGFGKSVLLEQVVSSRPDTAVLVRTKHDVDEALDWLEDAAPDTILVAVDDASQISESIPQLAEAEAVHTLCLADRVLNDDLRLVATTYGYESITASDLRFTESEFRSLVEAVNLQLPVAARKGTNMVERIWYLLGPASEGWPHAAVWMVQRALASADPFGTAANLASPGPDARAFADAHLTSLPEELASAVRSLAHFEAFPSSCVDTLIGPDGAARARRAGAALLAGERGWFHLPRAVSRPLTADGPMDNEKARVLGPVLIASAGILDGVRAMIKAGCLGEAARAFVVVPPSHLDDVDQQGIVDVVRILRFSDDTPRLALVEARAHRNLGDHESSDRCLKRCLELADSEWPERAGIEEVVLEARIERLFGKAFSPDHEATQEIAELRELITSSMSPSHGLRLDEIDALLRGQAHDPAEVDAACDDLFDIAARLEGLKEMRRAATVLRRMAASALSHLGRYHDGLDALEHASKISWHRLVDRALTIEISNRLRVLAGELEGIDPLLREAWVLAEAISEPWMNGFFHWTQGLLAARRNDPVRLLDQLRRAERELGPLLSHDTGVVFRSEMAAALAELGEFDEADHQLALVADRVDHQHVEFGLASATVAARRGDRGAADAILAALVDGGRMPPGRSWRVRLEAAIAAEVSGESDEVVEPMYAAALTEAAEYGHQKLADLVLGQAQALIADGDSSLAGRRGLRIEVLGHFAVTAGSRVLDLPDGHVRVLAKLLAVSGGPIPVDVALETLWPGAEERIGRRRIKNVVARLRSLVGAENVERTNETLAFSSAVKTDLAEFEAAVRQALQADEDPRLRASYLKSALQLYGGEVLPTDRYEDWAAEVRSATTARAMTVVDQVFNLEHGVRPAAAWLLDVLLRVDPADDTRLLRITRQALAENHPACARAALERALAAAQDLGISLDDEVRDLRYLLKTT